MKKTYITPASQAINFAIDGLLALSVNKNEKIDENTEWLAPEKGWNSDNWTSDEE